MLWLSDDFISLFLIGSLSGIFFSEELAGGVVTSDSDEVDGGEVEEEVEVVEDDEEEGAEEGEEEEEGEEDMNIDITDSRLDGAGEGVGVAWLADEL